MRLFSEVILSESGHSVLSELILGDSDGEGVAVDTFLRFGLSIILRVFLGGILRFTPGIILGIILSLIFSLVFSL